MNAEDKYLEQINFPESSQVNLIDEILQFANDPRRAAEICEYHFSQYNFSWKEGFNFLKNEGKKGTFKQMCSLFANIIISLNRQKNNIERAKKSTTLPFIKVSQGPVLSECNIHKPFYDKLIYFNPSFFEKYPFASTIECRCSWRKVSKIDAEKSGLILDEKVVAPWKPITFENIEKVTEKSGYLLKNLFVIILLIPVLWFLTQFIFR